MVDGYLGGLTTEQRMLIHLFDFNLPSNQWEAPFELTQAGISAAVFVQRKHVPRTLKRLHEQGFVDIDSRHVPGGKQKRKVYSLTNEGRNHAEHLIKDVFSKHVSKNGTNVPIDSIKKNGRLLLEILSHIDEKLVYHDKPVITSVAKSEGMASLDAQSGEVLVKRMFARAWEDGIITSDEQQLITEVVDFLGMHPDRVVRLSEEARSNIDIPPPEDIYLEMLRQALIDEELIDEEINLLATFRNSFNISEQTHDKLLSEAKNSPVYSSDIKTYRDALKAAMVDGIITNDEEAILKSLRKSLSVSDREHAGLLALIRDSDK